MRTHGVLPILVLVLAAAAAHAQNAQTDINQLVPPGTGDDSKARLDLRTLTNKSFRPGAESERGTHEGSLLKGLSDRKEWEVKSFLIDELALQGKSPATAPVSAYLADANLCEPASMALQMIGGTEGADKVLPVLRAAYVTSTGKCRVAIVNGLGRLREPDAASLDLLIKDAAAADKNLRAVALRALAESGDPKAKTALSEALKAADAYEHNRAVSLNLLFALRLAERGGKAEGIQVAGAVKALGTAESRKNIVTNADTTLARIGSMVVAIATQPGKAPAAAPKGRMQGGILIIMREGSYTLQAVDLRGKVLAEQVRKP